MRDLQTLSPPQLLGLQARISAELRARGISRSANNIVGDLAEHLFCRAFGWTQARNSMCDMDATDPAGRRFQIKARRIAGGPGSRQLGALRNLPSQGFDFLAAVLFQEDYHVHRGAIISHDQVLALSEPDRHTNSWRFLLRDSVWDLPGVQDVTDDLRKAELTWADAVSEG